MVDLRDSFRRKQLEDEIAWLQDDNVACKNAMRSATSVERAEFSARIRANNEEVRQMKAELKTL